VEVSGRTRERRLRQKIRLQQYRRRRRTLVLILLVVAVLLFLLPSLLPEPEPLARVSVPNTAPLSPPSIDAGKLRTDLENIARSHQGTYGVAVYDPESESTVSLDSTRSFYAASLAKLPTLFSLYRAAESGELSLDEPISILPTDVQRYGSGVLYKYPPGYDMSLRRCARYLIQESDNTAWVMLERRLGVERIQSDLLSIGATHTDYVALQTTPDDVLAVLKAISDPDRTSEKHSAEMLDLMTATAYEDRIPQPLPEDVRVAHKVGSYAGTYSDAAVVFGEGEEPYYIVVISEGATEAEARAAIRRMSLATYEALR
jgi:beta-lactamase class A